MTADNALTPICRWWRERWDPYWSSDCHNAAFEFNDGGPTDNGFRFCPHCGRELIEGREPILEQDQ